MLAGLLGKTWKDMHKLGEVFAGLKSRQPSGGSGGVLECVLAAGAFLSLDFDFCSL